MDFWSAFTNRRWKWNRLRTKYPLNGRRLYPFFYKQTKIGKYYADFPVDDKIIVEIKAGKALVPEHLAKALHYPAATKLRLALLLNFGRESLEFKRVIR